MQEHEGDARIQASVGRMQAVIEAGRAIREKHNKPLKQPLRRVTVVHPDPDFLADVAGEAVLGRGSGLLQGLSGERGRRR